MWELLVGREMGRCARGFGIRVDRAGLGRPSNKRDGTGNRGCQRYGMAGSNQ